LRNNEKILNADPLAQALVERNVRLIDLASHLNRLDARSAEMPVILRSLSSSDFGNALTAAAGAALPWLSASSAFVLADPNDSPVLARTYPESVGGEPILEPARAISTGPDGEPVYHDGLGIRFLFACGIDAVGRTGIAKIALS
jgi:hypothetical protein